ncbi:MAG: hypothetical protein FIA98_08450, partial [Anaerolineae bacterium]|nr:hypothetical protein [Anaerolineae bacterium]
MNREPTVLDYLKSLLHGKPLAIPAAEPAPQTSPESTEQSIERPEQMELLADSTQARVLPRSHLELPWRSLLALGLALVAQLSLLPRPNRQWIPGVILYLLAAGVLVCAVWKGEW